MRKAIIATGLATALAATSFAGSAMAGPHYGYRGTAYFWSSGPHHRRHDYRPYYVYHRHYRPYYGGYYGYGYDPGPAIIAGAIFGMIGTALAHQGYHVSHHHRRR